MTIIIQFFKKQALGVVLKSFIKSWKITCVGDRFK